MVTAFLLGYHRNCQSLCKPPLIEHIHFPGRLEYLLEDAPPVVKFKYKQILVWSGTHLCITSYATLYVRVILNIGVTCDIGKCVRAEWFYEQNSPYMFVPNPQGTTSRNIVLYRTSDTAQTLQYIALSPSCGHCRASVSLKLCWNKITQQETNKQEMEPNETNKTAGWMKQAESKPVSDFSSLSLSRQLFWTSS